jgi:hypothetical protein
MSSVRNNKPWNVLVREILAADGEDPAARAPARFTLDRGSEPNVIARDIGRIFFGRDLQCAQCHDSPLVPDYHQADYQGLLAFVAPGYSVTRKIGDKDLAVYAERAPTDLSFESVFIKGTQHRTGPRLPGSPAVDEPFFFPGEDYTVAPADKVRSIPKFSRRALLAASATDGSNEAFNQNIVNRLWAMLFGRGIVHPLDMIHAENPAASTQLLRQLGEQFAAMNFDMRGYLRALVGTRAYQAPFDLVTPAPTTADLSVAQVAELQQKKQGQKLAEEEAEQAWNAATEQYAAAEAALIPVAAESDTLKNAYADALKKRDEAQKAVSDAEAAVAARSKAIDALQQAVSHGRVAAEIGSDKELAQTIAGLETRVQQITAELPALQKATEEKRTAVTPLAEALAAARVPLETSLHKLHPVKQAIQQADAERVKARQTLQLVRADLNAIERQIAVTRSVTKLAEHNQEFIAVVNSVPDHEQKLALAGQTVAQFIPIMAEAEKRIQAAQEQMVGASEKARLMKIEADRQAVILATIASAAEALSRAKQALPNDSEIADSAGGMSQRLSAIQSALDGALSQLSDAEAASVQAAKAHESAVGEMQKSAAELEALKQRAAEAESTLASVKNKADGLRGQLRQEQGVTATELSSRFSLSALKPLSPEQLCFTVFRVTRIYDRYVDAERAELEKTSPLTDAMKADPAAMRSREYELEQRVYDKLKGNIDTFVQFYGGAPGQPQGEFYASPDQALFTSNAGAINGWIVPAADNATERIVKAVDSRKAAEELYLGILTRMPSDEEVSEVNEFLAAASDRGQAANELVWALISSAEFRFNR